MPLNPFPHNPKISQPWERGLLKTVGKGENAGNQHFLLFTQCFQPFTKQISDFQSHLFCHLQILSLRTGLKCVIW